MLLKKITTNKTWDDLNLDDAARKDLNEISMWINNEKTSDAKRLNNCKILFVGKTKRIKKLSAKILGKLNEADVYRVDISKVLSKYIGETEKNLQQVFNNAVGASVILFFDEADALFGKRTSVKDSHDRYSDSNVSYLFQKINQCPHFAIFNTGKYDDAGKINTQYFDKIIYFKKPS